MDEGEPNYGIRFRSPLFDCLSGDVYWDTIEEEGVFLVQQYKVGDIGIWIRSWFDSDPQPYRIITSVSPHKEVAVASTLEDIQIAWRVLKTNVFPKLEGISDYQTILEILSPLIAVIHAQMLQGQNLLKTNTTFYSFSFEYQYVKSRVQLKKEKPYLHCPICDCVVVDPVALKNSKYNLFFCKACIVKEMYLGNEEREINRDVSLLLEDAKKEVLSQLDELEVYCPFRFNGCLHVESRGKIIRHIEKCEYILFLCTNKNFGCTFSCDTVEKISHHVTECHADSTTLDLLKKQIPEEVLLYGLMFLPICDIMNVGMCASLPTPVLTASFDQLHPSHSPTCHHHHPRHYRGGC
eukprot:TRINITY_DN1876_c0_g1_i10.p1 TRINITY_DN1876_c0_g1~~TRINITY_DN1876_c0_g1_i10.p1  ORF type:complete len:378 (+),score=73.89 TRINITY_DN1876_c0_g1_i10:83-1135(+)